MLLNATDLTGSAIVGGHSYQGTTRAATRALARVHGTPIGPTPASMAAAQRRVIDAPIHPAS